GVVAEKRLREQLSRGDLVIGSTRIAPTIPAAALSLGKICACGPCGASSLLHFALSGRPPSHRWWLLLDEHPLEFPENAIIEEPADHNGGRSTKRGARHSVAGETR